MLLAGDIGGTKTTLAVFTGDDGLKSPVMEKTFPSQDYSRLEDIMEEFLRELGRQPTYVALGVAGPVMEGRARVTNLKWVIDAARLQAQFAFSVVHLLNDLQAIAEGVTILAADDLQVLHSGRPVRTGTIAVIAPGTGLGEAFLTWNGRRYEAHPSEGGHTNFGPLDDLQVDMLRYLMRRYGHVSYERVCSGSGLPNIYRFLKDNGYGDEPQWLTERLASTKDPTPVIVTAALDDEQPCDLCRRTVEIFVSILGSEAANLALKVMATGGLYIGGGIPPRIVPLLRTELFSRPFFNKGRLSSVLNDVPIYVILNPRVGLLGAARHALELQREEA